MPTRYSRSPAVCAVAAALVAACSRAPVTPALLVITELHGVTEPCGCTSKPLGGLDRVAARVEALRRDHGAALLVVGNTFFEHETPPAHLVEQEARKAEVIARVVGQLAPVTIVGGAVDAHHGEKARDLAYRNHLQLTLGREVGVRRRNVELGALRAGIVSAAVLDEAACTSAGAEAQRAREEGARIVVLALGRADAAARACVEGLAGVDVVVAPGGEELPEPRKRGKALWIEAGDKGRHLGVLTLHGEGGEEWTYFDGGRARREALEARARRLRGELDTLEPGAALEARRSRLAELEAELAAFVVPSAPAGKHLRWRAEAIDQTVSASRWASRALKDYNLSLCDAARASTGERSCAQASSPAETYAGSESCRACHAAAFALYDTTKHARAWKTLVDAGKSCDLGCVSCHTVGYEQPGGFCRLDDALRFANVGCESCHGPGAGHVKSPAARAAWGASFVRDPGESTCRACHSKEHSDLFSFDAYRPRILGPGHGEAPARAATP